IFDTLDAFRCLLQCDAGGGLGADEENFDSLGRKEHELQKYLARAEGAYKQEKYAEHSEVAVVDEEADLFDISGNKRVFPEVQEANAELADSTGCAVLLV